MIESGFVLSGPWAIFAIMAMAVAMLVNRAGASMVFFDVVGRFQAKRLIKDADTSMTLFNAIMLDTFANIQDSINVLGTGIQGWVNQLIPAVEALTDAEIQLKKFAEAATFDEMSEEVQQLGFEFGFTADAAMDAASRMAQLQSVLGTGMTPTGTQLGMEFGLISGMETEDAMTRLINLNQQLGFMQEGTEDLANTQEKANKIRANTIVVMDQLNTVENRSAATMEQVTFVMNQFASQAKLTGESISGMAAQSAVLIEAGEEQGKAGRALKMIYARLGGDINGARTSMEQLGIATIDANTGALRPMSDILTELAQNWDTFNGLQQQNIAQTIAGNRHYTRFIKLIENWDRVTQLTFESQLRMTPAMDEVNERLQNQITAYRGAEAELEKYRAELGQSFIPAMIAATERQTEFTKSLQFFVDLTGGAGQGIISMAMNLKNLVAPVLGLITNIAALTLAFQTQAQVARAMRGDEIALEQAYGSLGQTYSNTARFMTELAAIRNEEIASSRKQLAVARELTQAELQKQRSIVATSQKRMEAAEQELIDNSHLRAQKEIDLAERKHEIYILERVVSKKRELGLTTQQEIDLLNELEIELSDTSGEYRKLQEELAEITAANDNLRLSLKKLTREQRQAGDTIAGHVMKAREKEHNAIQEANDAAAEQTRQMYAMTGALTAAGSLVMMFAEDQKQMRIGMTLTTAGIVAMTAAQVKNTLAQIDWAGGAVFVFKQLEKVHLFIHGKSIPAIKMETAVIVENTGVKLANAGADMARTEAGIAQIGVQTKQIQGTKSLMASTLRMAGTLAIVYGAYKAINWALGKAVDMQKDYNDAVTLNFSEATSYQMSKFTEKLDEQAWTFDSLNVAIENNKKAQDDLSASQTQAAEVRLQELREELAILMDIRALQTGNTLATGENADEQKRVAEEIFKAKDDLEKLQDLTHDGDKWGVIESPFHMIPSVRETDLRKQWESNLGALERNEKTLKDLEDQYGHLFTFIEQTGVQTWEELEKAMETNSELWDEITGKVEVVPDLYVKSLEQATDSLYEFNNAREEFFWGASQPNMVGDLVKQVVQQGVENLITTTEVVMNNNFNGLTTDEMANEVLDAIERGAGLRDMNIR